MRGRSKSASRADRGVSRQRAGGRRLFCSSPYCLKYRGSLVWIGTKTAKSEVCLQSQREAAPHDGIKTPTVTSDPLSSGAPSRTAAVSNTVFRHFDRWKIAPVTARLRKYRTSFPVSSNLSICRSELGFFKLSMLSHSRQPAIVWHALPYCLPFLYTAIQAAPFFVFPRNKIQKRPHAHPSLLPRFCLPCLQRKILPRRRRREHQKKMKYAVVPVCE